MAMVLGMALTGFLLATPRVARAQTPTPLRPGFNRDVIYQVFVDRFFDGDAANDTGSLYDSSHTNWGKYWGGDFQGLTAKISYLQNMGVTAIWVTSPLDNRNVQALAGSTAPYHGYEMRDTLLPDEHFTNSINSWQPFDDFVTAAHSAGIKVIVDFAPNHSNVRGSGEDGRLAANGLVLATYGTDTSGFFHTGVNISGSQWDSAYETQYFTIYDLADLNQENPAVDQALKDAVVNLQNHGVDAFRLDATKHLNWGWQYSLANKIYTNKKSFCFGEWVADDSNNPLYQDMLKFTNKSGIAEINFPLYTALTSAFAQGGSFTNLNNVITQQQTDFVWQNDLVNFVDNHDRSRFLSIDASAQEVAHLHEALAFVLTTRGMPCIYYGTEQYLHNDTGGGGDPYNRPQMNSWSETTTAFQLINKLSTLRKNNEALPYGSIQQRWLNSNVFIYERKFFNSCVVVAINKSTSSQNVTNLVTSLSTGTYSDYLNGLLGGVSVTATTATSGGYNTNNFSLPANSVSVWQVDPAPTGAQVGALTPTVAQPGVKVCIAGQGFGSTTGTVKFGTTAATITSWNDKEIVCTVPNVANGTSVVTVTKSGSSTASNGLNFTVLQAKLIPVTFTAYSAYTVPGENVYITGNTVELSNWSTDKKQAPGSMLTESGTYPTWWLTVSLPAGKTIQFKYIKIKPDGTVTWEGGSNHSYTVPTSGVGSVNVTWQP